MQASPVRPLRRRGAEAQRRGQRQTDQALAMCSSAEQAGRLPAYVPLASAAEGRGERGLPSA